MDLYQPIIVVLFLWLLFGVCGTMLLLQMAIVSYQQFFLFSSRFIYCSMAIFDSILFWNRIRAIPYCYWCRLLYWAGHCFSVFFHANLVKEWTMPLWRSMIRWISSIGIFPKWKLWKCFWSFWLPYKNRLKLHAWVALHAVVKHLQKWVAEIRSQFNSIFHSERVELCL